MMEEYLTKDEFYKEMQALKSRMDRHFKALKTLLIGIGGLIVVIVVLIKLT